MFEQKNDELIEKINDYLILHSAEVYSQHYRIGISAYLKMCTLWGRKDGFQFHEKQSFPAFETASNKI